MAPWSQFKPSSKIFLLTVPRRYFFYGSFVLFLSCLCHAFASVHCCLLVTCWERADFLGSCLWCLIVFLSLSHVVSWVQCGTSLYWFLKICRLSYFVSGFDLNKISHVPWKFCVTWNAFCLSIFESLRRRSQVYLNYFTVVHIFGKVIHNYYIEVYCT